MLLNIQAFSIIDVSFTNIRRVLGKAFDLLCECCAGNDGADMFDLDNDRMTVLGQDRQKLAR